MRLPVSEDNSSRHWCDEPDEHSQNCSAAHLHHALQLLSLHGHASRRPIRTNKPMTFAEVSSMHVKGCMQMAALVSFNNPEQPSGDTKQALPAAVMSAATC